MGQYDNQPRQHGKGRERGQQDAKKAFAQLQSSGGGVQVTWESAAPELVHALVCWAGACGGAVRFGYNKDQTAYNVGLYLSGESTSYWINGGEDVDAHLRQLVEMYESYAREGAQQGAPAKK